MKTVVVGVPVFYGCDIQGVETAPDFLRSKGLLETLAATGHQVTDGGNIEVERVCESEKCVSHGRMKYVGAIERMSRQIADKVAGILRQGDFPLVIGGDHSDGIGILSGVSRVYGSDTAVLWIDSHSDIHQFSTSPSGNVHGVPLGAAIGLDCGPLHSVFEDHHIKSENIFIVGLRSYEPEEARIIAQHGVNIYSTQDVRRIGVVAIMADITEKLRRNGASALHVSFDIDSLDPAIAPGTGIRVPEGLTEEEAAAIVRGAFATGLVHSMDISELNPMRDSGEKTSRLALRIAGAIPCP